MATTNLENRLPEGSDRRFLLRANAGRRQADQESSNLLPGVDIEDEVARSTPATYLFILLSVLIIGVVSVRSINSQLAPLLYDDRHVFDVGEALGKGNSYLTYDLNIETRGMRRESIRSLDEKPDLAVMGASHWQEADGAIMPSVNFYNAHIHRDYYEDLVAVAGWFYEFDRMPEKIVISIRDNQFTPVEARTDFLWVPVLPYYREIAHLFGLEPHSAYANGLTPRLRQSVSLPVLSNNIERFIEATSQPEVSDTQMHETLDVLLPDGGIYWSEKHRRGFTAERARFESIALAEAKIASPPTLDPEGLKTFDRVLEFFVQHGVEVYITHPPFNPIFWEAVQGTQYMPALHRVEAAVQDLADKHGLAVIGGFNPHEVGCTSDMYIDGEHANPLCLGEILLQAYEGARHTAALASARVRQ